jgi:ATP-dependent protease ClpP protease subunit
MNKMNKMQKLTTRLDDFDEEDSPKFQLEHLPFYVENINTKKITVVLDENIREPKYYRNIIYALESLDEGDLCEIKIDSYGGRLDSAIAIINAMRNSRAEIKCSVTGVAASAGSLIALAAPSIYINEYSRMMIHQASFGTGGKQSDVMSHVTFENNRIKKIMKDVYLGFLTEKELETVFAGSELWFDADQIIERLEQCNKFYEKQLGKTSKGSTKTRKSKVKALAELPEDDTGL